MSMERGHYHQQVLKVFWWKFTRCFRERNIKKKSFRSSSSSARSSSYSTIRLRRFWRKRFAKFFAFRMLNLQRNVVQRWRNAFFEKWRKREKENVNSCFTTRVVDQVGERWFCYFYISLLVLSSISANEAAEGILLVPFRKSFTKMS